MNRQTDLENPELLNNPEAQVKFLKEKYGYTCLVRNSHQADNYFFIFKMEDKEPIRVAYGKFEEISFNTIVEGKRVNRRKVAFIPEEPPEELPKKAWWKTLIPWR